MVLTKTAFIILTAVQTSYDEKIYLASEKRTRRPNGTICRRMSVKCFSFYDDDYFYKNPKIVSFDNIVRRGLFWE